MFGKIIGGGFPVGAIGGSEEVMSAFDPRNRGSIFHSGTFNGNPVTCAAGAVSVRELTQARIDKMAKQAERLAAELARAARQAGLPFSVRHYGSLMNLFFLKEPPPATIAREDAPRDRQLPSGGAQSGFVSCTARDDRALDRDH